MSFIKSLPPHIGEAEPRVMMRSVGQTLTFGEYRLSYEVYGSGDRVLVWLNPILFDSQLSRGLARALAARGNRVVLLDLLGHGRSDKPAQPSAHRMDLYARHVVALLDELGVDRAVLGGISLGTNVSLVTAAMAPERVRGLVLEMPVLETAAPAAALTFVPLLLQVRYAQHALRLVSRVAARLPSSGIGPLDSLVGLIGSDPNEISAVLRGVLVGPIAPTVEERRAITAPALVLGHGIDLIHSFADAKRLARQLPNARLIRTRTFAELWVSPARLTGEIAAFLDQVWAQDGLSLPPEPRAASCQQQLGQVMVDAPGQHVQVGVGRVVAGDAERDGAVVAEDGDAGADHARDGNVGDDLLQPPAHPVERLTGTRYVGGDRDDLPLRERERLPDEPGGQRVDGVAAQGDERLADHRLVA